MMPAEARLPLTHRRVAALFANPSVEAQVVQALEEAGLQVDRYPSPNALTAALHSGGCDLAVVEDFGSLLAGCLTILRFRGISSAPVVAVGKGSLTDIIRAYRLGAVDYGVHGDINEVFIKKISARIEMSKGREVDSKLRAGACSLDTQLHLLRGPSGECQLTSREFALAWVLFENAGRVVNLRTLSQHVWGRDVSLAKRTIEQHVCRLRQKLRQVCSGDDDEQPILKAVHGVGYRLVLEHDPPAPVPAPSSAHPLEGCAPGPDRYAEES